MSVDLVADVGNLRTKLALFQGDDLVARHVVAHDEDLEAACKELCAGWIPRRAALSSVCPEPAKRFAAWCKDVLHLQARWLGADLPSLVALEVEEPDGVGADRLANAAWAARIYPRRSVVVVDLGTAITFDVVSSKGAFVGGAIAAGVSLRSRALNEHTALLPLVSLPGADQPPPEALGKDTQSCLQGGLFWGTVGLIDTVCARLAGELEEDPIVVATGGDAELFAPHCSCVALVVPDVTLIGVHYALVAAQGRA